ncbi:MAG: hypothetical protein VX911_09370 [Candidatus Latescibacterota bacterium]|nr:hypothetical protein [Candidatus Latescibacterota bacterium]
MSGSEDLLLKSLGAVGCIGSRCGKEEPVGTSVWLTPEGDIGDLRVVDDGVYQLFVGVEQADLLSVFPQLKIRMEAWSTIIEQIQIYPSRSTAVSYCQNCRRCEDPDEFSPVELAGLRGLELERLDFQITAPRERLEPERIKRQQAMLAEQEARLAMA